MLFGCARPASSDATVTELLRADFEPAPGSVPRARRAVLRSLMGRGIDRVADTTCLLTSELVTNAVQHAQHSLGVVVDVDATRVRVEVRDDGKRTPPPLREAEKELGSYWLLLLSDLASRWGFEHERGGGGVSWFEVELAEAAPSPRQPTACSSS
jgi:two-component sensor histidine kinase